MFGDFEQYLRRKAYIQEKYVPYYLKWVTYCYLFLDQPEHISLISDQLQSYLNHIAKTREDWQVKQAETALRLYGYFLSSKGEAPAETAVTNTSPENRDLWTADISTIEVQSLEGKALNSRAAAI